MHALESGASISIMNLALDSAYGDFHFDPVMGFAHRVSRYANPAPSDFGVFDGIFGSGRLSNGQEMAVGFK